MGVITFNQLIGNKRIYMTLWKDLSPHLILTVDDDKLTLNKSEFY